MWWLEVVLGVFPSRFFGGFFRRFCFGGFFFFFFLVHLVIVDGVGEDELEVIDAEDMVREVISTLERTNRVTRASVYLLDSEGQRLVLRGALGGTSPPRRLDVSARRPFVERMLEHGALLRDVLQREHERSEREARAELGEVLDTLTELGASLAVPIVSKGQDHEDAGHTPEVMGAVLLDDERLLADFDIAAVAVGVCNARSTRPAMEYDVPPTKRHWFPGSMYDDRDPSYHRAWNVPLPPTAYQPMPPLPLMSAGGSLPK